MRYLPIFNLPKRFCTVLPYITIANISPHMVYNGLYLYYFNNGCWHHTYLPVITVSITSIWIWTDRQTISLH